MLRVTFNRPAVDVHFGGLPDDAGIEIRLADGRAGFRLAKPGAPVVGKVLAPEARRGGASVRVAGDVGSVGAALLNPDGNPFFLLGRRDGWVVATPYVERAKGVGRKSEPRRTDPHLRVWIEGNEHPGAPARLDASERLTPAVVSAVRTLADPAAPPGRRAEAAGVMGWMEALARHVVVRHRS